jgi:endonuclease YncB( thermonuclease family)
MVFVKKRIWGFLWPETKNVSLELVKQGLACVYSGIGAEYGGIKDELIKAEGQAKKARLGMWSLKNPISPMAYKKKPSN